MKKFLKFISICLPIFLVKCGKLKEMNSHQVLSKVE